VVDTQPLKERVWARIDAHREEIIALGEDVRLHPELGFKEFRTAALVADRFRALGLDPATGLAVTGVRSTLHGARSLATVAYMGEMDSIVVRAHPDADPVTGAAHACGHNAQVANLVALACGLVESGVMSDLDGDVALMAVPAEEYVEVEYRMGLRAAGQIEFLGGKPELIRLGCLDDVDLTLMTHQATLTKPQMLSVGGPSNGCLVKQIRYEGVPAHAGGSPHEGVNALSAAALALQAIDSNRPTFKDEDHIRVHPIITRGGELVNVIPADVRLETYVRGASVDAIVAAARKVDRALRAGAMAVGATVHIHTLAGYLPRLPSDGLTTVYRANAVALVGEEGWSEPKFGGGSTYMGDVSHLMPAIEAQASGAAGTGHGADYRISDPEMAYITPAKVAAGTLIDLLADGAQRAREIVNGYQPPMTREAYLAAMRALFREEHWQAPADV